MCARLFWITLKVGHTLPLERNTKYTFLMYLRAYVEHVNIGQAALATISKKLLHLCNTFLPNRENPVAYLQQGRSFVTGAEFC